MATFQRIPIVGMSFWRRLWFLLTNRMDVLVPLYIVDEDEPGASADGKVN